MSSIARSSFTCSASFSDSSSSGMDGNDSGPLVASRKSTLCEDLYFFTKASEAVSQSAKYQIVMTQVFLSCVRQCTNRDQTPQIAGARLP